MPYTLPDARSRLNTFARTRTGFGASNRDLNEDEWSELGRRSGYAGGNDISDDIYGRAESEIGRQYGLNTTGGSATGETRPPGVGTNPNPTPQTGNVTTTTTTGNTGGTTTGGNTSLADAQARLNAYARGSTKFGASNRDLNEAEWQELAKRTGYTGGDVSPDLYNRAQQEILNYYGASTPTTPTGNTTPQTPTTPGNLAGNTGGQDFPGGGQADLGRWQDFIAAFRNMPTSPTSALQGQTDAGISQLLGQLTQPVSITDPALAGSSAAFRGAQERGYERARNIAAERGQQRGTLNSGGFDNQIQQIGAGTDMNIAANDAALVQGETEQRRAALLQALGLGAQTAGGTRDAELRERLGLGDLALGGRGQNLQGGLGFGNLDLQQMLGTGDLDLRRLLGQNQFTLGRGALGIDLLNSLISNDNFYSQLGLNAAQLTSGMNSDAIRTLFGGLQ